MTPRRSLFIVGTILRRRSQDGRSNVWRTNSREVHQGSRRLREAESIRALLELRSLPDPLGLRSGGTSRGPHGHVPALVGNVVIRKEATHRISRRSQEVSRPTLGRVRASDRDSGGTPSQARELPLPHLRDGSRSGRGIHDPPRVSRMRGPALDGTVKGEQSWFPRWEHPQCRRSMNLCGGPSSGIDRFHWSSRDEGDGAWHVLSGTDVVGCPGGPGQGLATAVETENGL